MIRSGVALLVFLCVEDDIPDMIRELRLDSHEFEEANINDVMAVEVGLLWLFERVTLGNYLFKLI